MSWAEVFKINSDLKKPLNTLISELISALSTKVTSVDTKVGTVDTKVGNVSTQVSNVSTQVGNVNTAVGTVSTKVTQIGTQVQGLKCLPIRVITSTTTYTPEKTGLYKVICVGAGGSGYVDARYEDAIAGGGGGVAIKTINLTSTTAYNVTVGSTASFAYSGGAVTATAGSAGRYNGAGAGGTASGGDLNYTGVAGDDNAESMVCPRPGSVGVYIAELYRSKSTWVTLLGASCEIQYGDNLLGYGGSGNAVYNYEDSDVYDGVEVEGLPAAVIIVPLE